MKKMSFKARESIFVKTCKWTFLMENRRKLTKNYRKYSVQIDIKLHFFEKTPKLQPYVVQKNDNMAESSHIRRWKQRQYGGKKRLKVKRLAKMTLKKKAILLLKKYISTEQCEKTLKVKKLENWLLNLRFLMETRWILQRFHQNFVILLWKDPRGAPLQKKVKKSFWCNGNVSGNTVGITSYFSEIGQFIKHFYFDPTGQNPSDQKEIAL